MPTEVAHTKFGGILILLKDRKQHASNVIGCHLQLERSCANILNDYVAGDNMLGYLSSLAG